MPIPVTFSAPGEEFTPAVEDALRYAVWLAHVADNLIARRYANDRRNLAAGVRIVQTWNNKEITDGLTSLKQLIVQHYFPDSSYQQATMKRGVKTVTIGALHLWPYDTRHASNNVDANEETANAVAERSELIFQYGTLYTPIQETESTGILIDPYLSPRFTAEDAPSPELVGAYDPDRAVRINDAPPKISRRTERVSRRDIRPDENPFALPPSTWMIIYAVYAEYEVQITNRETMSRGGPLG